MKWHSNEFVILGVELVMPIYSFCLKTFSFSMTYKKYGIFIILGV